MKRKFYFNVNKLMAVATTVCLFASGCGSTANTSDSAVADTTKPVITVSKKELSVVVGDKEWSKSVATNFKVVDDTDGNLKEVEKIEDGKAGYVVDDDKVDSTKAGTYAVLITAVDSSGNTVKSSFNVKVTEDKAEAETETESKETEKAESKSESSSSNSSATNSSSTSNSSANKNTGSSSGSSASSSSSGSSGSASKPSTGSGTTSSGSTSKPSTGGSTSSGSSTASKPSTGSSSSSGSSTGSGSSGSSSGSTAKPTTPTCKTVVVKEAWTETVVDKEAWTETIWIVDAPAYNEPIYEVKTICNECDKILNTAEEIDQHTMSDPNSPCFLAGYSDASVQTGIRHVPEVGHYETINHPAETHTVNHPAETKEVCS